MLRKFWLLAFLTAVVPLGAHAVTKDVFVAKSARDLVKLCTADAGDPHHELAKGYCIGYVSAAMDYHGVIARSEKLPPVSCAPPGTTRQNVIDMFLAWAANNEALVEVTAPLDGLMQAAHQKWPCKNK